MGSPASGKAGGKQSKTLMMLLIVGVMTNPWKPEQALGWEGGWIDLKTEHRLTGLTTARTDSRNFTESTDATR
jgi:hypothetical protein